MTLAEDSYMGAVIGLLVASKRIVETAPVNMEAFLATCVLLYLALGLRIGYHWARFAGLLLFTALSYAILLRPHDLAKSTQSYLLRHLLHYTRPKKVTRKKSRLDIFSSWM